MDEVPDRPIVHLEPALGQLRHQTAQGEVAALDPVRKPDMMLAPDRLRLVAADRAGATLPVSRNRRTQWITVLIPTPNR